MTENRAKLLSYFLIAMLVSCKPSIRDLFTDAEGFERIKNYKKAIETYDKIITRNDTIPLAYHNRGICFQNIGKYKEAITDFNKVIELQPIRGGLIFIPNRNSPWISEKDRYTVDPYEAIYQKALAEYSIDSLKNSFLDFQTCADNDHYTYNCYLWQGTIYIRLGNREKGCEYYQKSILFEPEDANRLIKENCQ